MMWYGTCRDEEEEELEELKEELVDEDGDDGVSGVVGVEHRDDWSWACVWLSILGVSYVDRFRGRCVGCNTSF
jgi:hypothetical protein